MLGRTAGCVSYMGASGVILGVLCLEVRSPLAGGYLMVRGYVVTHLWCCHVTRFYATVPGY